MMKYEPVESIATRFQQALDSRGMTQKDLVAITGISSASLSQYATGKVQPKQDRIYLIAKALSVDEAWLMGFDVPMKRTARLNEVNTDSIVDIIVDDESKTLIETFNRLNSKKREMLIEFANMLLDL